MKIMKFGADWCSACKEFDNKMTDKVLDEISKMGFIYENYDVDSSDALTYVEHYKIKSIPTIIVLNDDCNIVNKIVGDVNIDEFLVSLRELYAEKLYTTKVSSQA